jgi:hypothetical protein
MASRTCPDCGHPTEIAALACSTCGRATAQPTLPAEVSGWTRFKTPPDLLAWARQTCSEEECLAALREVEQTGGLELKDLLAELEAAPPPRD